MHMYNSKTKERIKAEIISIDDFILCVGVYLQVPVVHGAAAVSGLRRLFTVIEQAAQLTEEAGPRHDELHSC